MWSIFFQCISCICNKWNSHTPHWRCARLSCYGRNNDYPPASTSHSSNPFLAQKLWTVHEYSHSSNPFLAQKLWTVHDYSHSSFSSINALLFPPHFLIKKWGNNKETTRKLVDLYSSLYYHSKPCNHGNQSAVRTTSLFLQWYINTQ